MPQTLKIHKLTGSSLPQVVQLSSFEHKNRHLGEISVGSIFSKGGRWRARGVDGRSLGVFEDRIAAVEVVKRFWQDHFSAEAVKKDFYEKTKARHTVSFCYYTEKKQILGYVDAGKLAPLAVLFDEKGRALTNCPGPGFDLVPRVAFKSAVATPVFGL